MMIEYAVGIKVTCRTRRQDFGAGEVTSGILMLVYPRSNVGGFGLSPAQSGPSKKGAYPSKYYYYCIPEYFYIFTHG